ncbi:unnamed protein product, partial [Urochloa humidicola]
RGEKKEPPLPSLVRATGRAATAAVARPRRRLSTPAPAPLPSLVRAPTRSFAGGEIWIESFARTMDNNFNGSSGLHVRSEELFGEDKWAFGYSAAMGSLDVPPNTQFNMVGSSQMSYPPAMNGQPSQGLSIDNNQCNQLSLVLCRLTLRRFPLI